MPGWRGSLETEGSEKQTSRSCQTAKKLKVGENWNLVFGCEQKIKGNGSSSTEVGKEGDLVLEQRAGSLGMRTLSSLSPSLKPQLDLQWRGRAGDRGGQDKPTGVARVGPSFPR